MGNHKCECVDGCEELTDGYHTFSELYEYRKMYNALLFKEWKKEGYFPHKSKRHHDGELCFGGEWFIVAALTKHGQITNHYPIEDWDLFDIPETGKIMFEFDGHTSQDVIDRMKSELSTG